jgi:hypothetical protein
MTRMIRLLLAIAAGALLLVAFPPTAEAGESSVLGVDIECNEETGDYDVVFTIVNGTGDAGDITVVEYDVDGVDQTPPVFDPDPVPASGESVANDSIPGSSTSLFIDIEVDYGDPIDFLSAEQTLEGDCEPTTTTTTAGETTTTEAAAAEAVRLQPAFTG